MNNIFVNHSKNCTNHESKSNICLDRMIDPTLSKHCLYLALYSRDGYVPTFPPKEDRHHWALLVIPHNSIQATRVHARDFFSGPDQTHWLYEEIHVDARSTSKLLAKTLIGDIDNLDGLFEIMRDVPIDQETRKWNCISWIRDALRAVGEDGEVVTGRSGAHSWSAFRKLALAAADVEKTRRDNVVKSLL